MATLDCTNNIIGIRGACNASTPISLLYLDDLPGITLERAASIADGNSVTGADVASIAITNGVRRVKNLLLNEMLNIVRFNAVTFSRLAANFTQDKFEPATLIDSGVQIELCSTCRLVELYIPSVNVQLQDAGAYTLKILDGGTVTTFDFTAIAGETVCVVTNYRPTTDKVQVLVEAGARPNQSTLNTCCFICPCGTLPAQGAGAKLTGVGGDTSKSYGVQPLVNLECSETRFFCEVKHLVYDAILYASGAEFMSQALATDRVGVFTTYGDEDAKEARADWVDESEMIIKKVVKQLPAYLATIDSCCISCNSNHWAYSLP